MEAVRLTQDEYREWSILRRIGAVGMLWNRPSDAMVIMFCLFYMATALLGE